MKINLQNKAVRAAFLAVSILMGVFSVHGIISFAQQSHTRWIEQDFAAASDELQKSPPGFARAEAFLKRLKAINPDYAPAEVKQALHDYISAFEQALDTLKAGKDTSRSDASLAEAQERLLASVRKYH